MATNENVVAVALPEDMAPEMKEMFAKPEFQAALSKIVETQVAPLKAKRDELLASSTSYKKQLDALDNAKTQAELAAAEVSRKAALEAAQKTGDVEKITSQYSKQLQDKETELSSFKQKVVDKEISLKVANAIAAAGGVPELLEYAVRGRVKASMEGSDIKISVLNSDGAQMLKSDGVPATMADLMEEFKGNEVYGRAFTSTGTRGAGSRASSDVNTDASNPFDRKSKEFNVSKAMEIARTNPEKAKRLAQAAGVKY